MTAGEPFTVHRSPFTVIGATEDIMAMEEIKVSGAKLKATLKQLIREGNVRRIILRNARGRTLLDMPLSAGLAGALLLPFWVAVGAVVALATDFTILVERDPDLPAR